MRVVADLHTHTVASGHAYGTLIEMARHAALNGLSLVAITDHGPAMPGGTHRYYFGNLPILPSMIEGVQVLKGIEANILDIQGRLDLERRYLEKLDWVAAGLHSDCVEPSGIEDNTRALISTMESGLVDVIVHPGNPRFPIDHEAFVMAAVHFGVAIELNNSSLVLPHRKGSEKNCLEIAELAVRHNAAISLGSDAHSPWQVGGLERALRLATVAGAEERDILNTSVDKITEFCEKRRRDRRRVG